MPNILLTPLDALVASPFARLTELLKGLEPGMKPTDLSLGEPKAVIPPFLGPVLQEHLREFGRYPPIRGIPALRQAIADWMGRRYPALAGHVDAERHLLPLNGSREGLFSAIFPALARKPGLAAPAVLIPNPFYQAYAAAAAASGAVPHFLASASRKGCCVLRIALYAAESVNHAPRSTSGISIILRECGGHSMEQKLLTSFCGSQSPSNAQPLTSLPLFCRVTPSSMNSPAASNPVSS